MIYAWTELHELHEMMKTGGSQEEKMPFLKKNNRLVNSDDEKQDVLTVKRDFQTIEQNNLLVSSDNKKQDELTVKRDFQTIEVPRTQGVKPVSAHGCGH